MKNTISVVDFNLTLQEREAEPRTTEEQTEAELLFFSLRALSLFFLQSNVGKICELQRQRF